jgi:type IV pilus assembly protein PilY1
VLSDIQAGVTLDGTWVAIFGNGYESKSCQASLFIVNLETGALLKEIKTNVGNCSTARNGLGGVRLVKNANQQVIGVYAGDLRGNMWKFNLNSSSPGSWGLDLGGNPLFTAGTTQPITAPPAALKLPMLGTGKPDTGHMVVFGTGKFYEVSDITSTNGQALYGIWDTQPFGSTTTSGVALTDKSLLVQQTISAAQTGPNGNTYFAISSNPVDYATTPAKRGWYINLPNTGQRMVYPLDLLADRFVVADTISPANVSLDPCANSSGGAGFLYVFDAHTGGGPTEPVLDTNGDNNVDSADMMVSGIESKADGRNVTLEVEKNDLQLISANVSGGDPGATFIKISCKLTNTCKAAGAVIKRQWRQLYLR